MLYLFAVNNRYDTIWVDLVKVLVRPIAKALQATAQAVLLAPSKREKGKWTAEAITNAVFPHRNMRERLANNTSKHVRFRNMGGECREDTATQLPNCIGTNIVNLLTSLR